MKKSLKDASLASLGLVNVRTSIHKYVHRSPSLVDSMGVKNVAHLKKKSIMTGIE